MASVPLTRVRCAPLAVPEHPSARRMKASHSFSLRTAAALPLPLAALRGLRSIQRRRTPRYSFQEFQVPAGYNWEICTQQNYARQDSKLADGPLAPARKLVDASYHGNYTMERQSFQDALVRRLVESGSQPRKQPLLVFTAGAMGVGKSSVIRWLAEREMLSLTDFVHINPDLLATELPEYPGYVEKNRASAAVMTRLEAGLLTELSLMYSLQQRRNILVDSSLRHGSWYSRVLQKIRRKLPDVRVVLMYVHAREETVYARAIQRGQQGRAVSHAEVADSLEKLPRAIQKLLPYVDMFVQVDNDGDDPVLTSVCTQPRDEDGAYCEVTQDPEELGSMGNVAWSSVAELLRDASAGESDVPLPEPPRILPGPNFSEPQPLSVLFETIIFAATKHQNQTRKNPERTPYINHPLAVARTLAEVGIRDLATLQAALLHDTLEDTDTSCAELDASFGPEVRELVEALTDDDRLRPLEQKLRQLKGAKALPWKAKLVRISDKMHNVHDLLRSGIPGWSKEKTERYVAWACEMVDALRGTHAALEQRFHKEVTLPPGYRLGDWEEFATQKTGNEGWPVEDSSSGPALLREQRAVLSLLRAAEFVAWRNPTQLLDSVKFALLLSRHDIKDPETLKAGLLLGTAEGKDLHVAQAFGPEVAAMLAALEAPWPRMVKDLKAKRILLGKHLHELRKLQLGTIETDEDLVAFRELLSTTMALRETLRGSHPPLEQGLDAVFNGQVRMASGELTPVYLQSEWLGEVTCNG
ncbi:unnamed protein product [Effrenium voratum]|nr:unnamed protein product [Effrenium voratum]